MRSGEGTVVLVLAVLVCGLVLGQQPAAVEDEAPAVGVQAEAEEAVSRGIKMADFSIRGRLVRGRITHEDDKTIKIEQIGAGEIGYDKALIADLKRYALSRSEYNEMLGDFYADKTWDFKDDEDDFVQARRSYEKALAGALEEGAEERLQNKIGHILKERNEWQQEAIMRVELQKAEDEAEAARLQKELTQKNLDAADRFGELADKLQGRVGRLESNADLLARELRDVNRVISDMRRDIERLEDDVRAPTVVIYSLRRSFDSLTSRVDSLERQIRTRPSP